MKFLWIKAPYVHYGNFILRAFDCIVTVSFGYILCCVCFNLYCGGFILLCEVCVCVGVCVGVCVCVCVCVSGCVCVGFVMCGGFGIMYPDSFFRAFSSFVRQMPG